MEVLITTLYTVILDLHLRQTTSSANKITNTALKVDLRLVGVVADTVIAHFTEELDAENAVQRHEEQEEDRHVVDLLAGTPVHVARYRASMLA